MRLKRLHGHFFKLKDNLSWTGSPREALSHRLGTHALQYRAGPVIDEQRMRQLLRSLWVAGEGDEAAASGRGTWEDLPCDAGLMEGSGGSGYKWC